MRGISKGKILATWCKIYTVKLLALLIFIAGISASIYLFIVHIKKFDWGAFRISAAIGIVLVVLLGILIAKTANPRDTWCDSFKVTNNYPPMQTVTAMDYFEKGNYEYDIGNCTQAIADYTKSIELNPKYPQAYNNRAFTYMRMQENDKALTDLNRALEINPNYINALMNRGDVYRDRKGDKEAAIADYEKIISFAGTRGTSVCGHLAMAKHYNKNWWSNFVLPFEVFKCRGRI